MRLHRWILHVELSIFQVWTLILQVECDFTTWRWFRNLEMICNFICSLEVISQCDSQLRRWRHGLRNGTREPKVGFAAHFAATKWALGCEISYSLMQLPSNSHNFFVSAPICTRLKRWTLDFPSFETTYSMHKMDFRKWSKCVQQLLSSWISC